MELNQIAIIILGLYCSLMFFDFLTIRKKLRNSLEEGRKKPASHSQFCYTLAGRSLLRLAENVQHKLAALNWQAEHNNQNTLSSKIIDNESQKAGNFFQGMLIALFSKLRADTVYIITMVDDGENSIEIQQSHSRNSWALPPKLTSYLVNFYHSYFKQADQSLLGLRDGFQSKSLTGEFYLFGYRYVIALPISYKNHENKTVRGLMWLGYNKNAEPYPHEINIAKEVCTKIENEFAAQRIIEELSAKVKEEKGINKQRDEFLAHVSHDIRSPMNNIRSIINLMRLEVTDKEELELLDTALGNCHDVEELISTILDFTRFQAGQLTNKVELLDIHNLLEEIVNNQKIEAKIKNIPISLKSCSNGQIFLNVDKKQIKRVINNLVNNAIKYTRQGSIEVTMASNEEDFCSIKISDTGVGMTAEQLKLLFTPFYRFHQKEAGGIGLGLTLSKILTEMNGGKISVTSTPNQGSVFEVSFPCQVKIPAKPERIKAFSEGKVSTVEVLVLDDNAAAVDSLSKVLVKMGFNVTKCYTVSDAISIINFSPPQFLISDWQMPEGGAKRLLKYLKLINSPVKVCVLTGSSEPNTKTEISKFDVEKIFCKSEDFEEMHEWLNSIQTTSEPDYSNNEEFALKKVSV
jgi:signal transduction histidine kinase/CheY-like chemotaxis protein